MGYVFISDEPRARLLRPVVRAIMRLAFGGARSRLILQNPDDVEFFAKRGIAARDQIHLIPGSGVDCERFLPPATTSANKGPLRVVLAARMLWDKGVREFVEAAKILKAEGRNVTFVLAGVPDPGNPASIPDDVLLGWQAAGLADWLGHVEDMPALLAGADIVALPSYREGLPKSLIEAASCGRPLITTDVPGCRAVVTDGVDGLLVPVRDAAALARAVARLHDDARLARSLGKAARAKALREFDERHIVDRTLEVYRDLIEERSARHWEIARAREPPTGTRGEAGQNSWQGISPNAERRDTVARDQLPTDPLSRLTEYPFRPQRQGHPAAKDGGAGFDEEALATGRVSRRAP